MAVNDRGLIELGSFVKGDNPSNAGSMAFGSGSSIFDKTVNNLDEEFVRKKISWEWDGDNPKGEIIFGLDEYNGSYFNELGLCSERTKQKTVGSFISRAFFLTLGSMIFNSGNIGSDNNANTLYYVLGSTDFNVVHNVPAITGSSGTITGSKFYVNIVCGSVVDIGSFNINGCTSGSTALGSYTVYGPDGPTLGSSRARVMKTLFYGTDGSDPRIGSTYIYNMSLLQVPVNTFNDIGKKAYYMDVIGSTENDYTKYWLNYGGSFENTGSGVDWWSYLEMMGSPYNVTNSTNNSKFFIDGTLLGSVYCNGSTTTFIQDQTGLDMGSVINPSTTLMQFKKDSIGSDLWSRDLSAVGSKLSSYALQFYFHWRFRRY